MEVKEDIKMKVRELLDDLPLVSDWKVYYKLRLDILQIEFLLSMIDFYDFSKISKLYEDALNKFKGETE